MKDAPQSIWIQSLNISDVFFSFCLHLPVIFLDQGEVPLTKARSVFVSQVAAALAEQPLMPLTRAKLAIPFVGRGREEGGLKNHGGC